MALPKSGKSGSNVLKLDDVRRRRLKPPPADISDPSRSMAADDPLTNNSSSTDEPPATLSRRRSDKSVDTTNAAPHKPGEIKTPAKRSRVSNRRFDRAKVDRIKEEIASGKYTIDYLQVADKFIEHERYS